MPARDPDKFFAFIGNRLHIKGEPVTVVPDRKRSPERRESSPRLVFEARSNQQAESDLRGSKVEVLPRLCTCREVMASAERVQNQPRLGVIMDEVTLPGLASWRERWYTLPCLARL